MAWKLKQLKKANYTQTRNDCILVRKELLKAIKNEPSQLDLSASVTKNSILDNIFVKSNLTLGELLKAVLNDCNYNTLAEMTNSQYLLEDYLDPTVLHTRRLISKIIYLNHYANQIPEYFTNRYVNMKYQAKIIDDPSLVSSSMLKSLTYRQALKEIRTYQNSLRV